MIDSIIFYVFSTLIVFAALAVISARNPVHSVLFLIFTFFNSAGIFVLLGAEFLAMILVIVYVGAVAVLFLFVVMMLDIDLKKLQAGFMRYLPLGVGLVGVLFIEMIAIIYSGAFSKHNAVIAMSDNNTQLIGNRLYTDDIFLFQIAGLILLVAMIGAIVLTLRHRSGVRRQIVHQQRNRSIKDEVHLVNVPSGGNGIENTNATSNNTVSNSKESLT